MAGPFSHSNSAMLMHTQVAGKASEFGGSWRAGGEGKGARESGDWGRLPPPPTSPTLAKLNLRPVGVA